MGFFGLMGKTLASVSIAVDDPKTALPLIRASTRLIFGANGIRSAYINISSKRVDWIRSLERVIGFRAIDVVKDGLGPSEDLILFKLTPETCRPWQAELRKSARAQMREAS